MRYGEARAIWEELLAGPGAADKILAREARTNIVKLWGLTRELPAQVAPLAGRFAATPPDLEAGRLLAEVQRKLHRLAEAEATLRRVVTLAPGDEESLLALERVLVQGRQSIAAAIEVLAKLVEVDPKRAREFYQRMAQYAADLYHDDDAIRYAGPRRGALARTTPCGHQKLGDDVQAAARTCPTPSPSTASPSPRTSGSSPCTSSSASCCVGHRPGGRGRPALPPRGARLAGRGAGLARGAHEHAGQPGQGHPRASWSASCCRWPWATRRRASTGGSSSSSTGR